MILECLLIIDNEWVLLVSFLPIISQLLTAYPAHQGETFKVQFELNLNLRDEFCAIRYA